MEKLYKDRDWLYEHYIVRKESSSVMAKEADCNLQTILNWLRKLGISVRGNGGLWRDRNWLWGRYIVREKSSSVMAKEAQCSNWTICHWLHKYGIPVRNRGEASFLALRNSVIITPDLLKFLGGELQGDGCVSMHGNRSAYYSHSSKYEEYLIWLSERFDKWGIEQAGRITDYISKKTNTIFYRHASRSYPELVDVYKHWYPNGKKIVPKDLKLTPIMARQWYIGDGCLKNSQSRRPSIKFNTQAFDKKSIEYLVKELGRLGFKATRQPSDNTIYLWVCSVQDFLKWIGPCPISCYDYKWAI